MIFPRMINVLTMSYFRVEADKPVMVIDIDNVMLQTSPHMSSTTGIQMETEDRKEIAPFAKQMRWNYLRDSSRIDAVSLCDGTLFFLPILENYFELHILSARWDDQIDVWNKKFERHGLLKYFSGLHLRGVNDQDDQMSFKLKKTRELDAQYAVEDFGPLAWAFSEDMQGVVLPNRAWNGDVFGPNIFRCREPIDFAIALVQAGGPESLFASRKAFLTSPANKSYVYEAENLEGISIVITSCTGSIPTPSPSINFVPA